MAEEKTVITLMCERAADVNDLLDKNNEVQSVPGLKVVKLPCSGMIQPLMIEAAMKAGASGVIVCGCQIGDCYFREGNRMIRERLLGERPPTLKKTVDRRRVMALWLSRRQKNKFESEAKEFVAYVNKLEPAAEAAKPAAPAPKPAAAPAAAAKAEAAGPTPKEAEKAKEATAKEAAPEKAVEAKEAASEKVDAAAAAEAKLQADATGGGADASSEKKES
ncbi:MAG: hydrogenase iron-sulfur subunit [Candidatus Obscuribacterales bacterium]|nr:hydrogenase iron-sulfur subunit [Candidatus Obscuribacterales bacterium]